MGIIPHPNIKLVLLTHVGRVMKPAMNNVAIPAITIACALGVIAAAVQLLVIPINVGLSTANLMTAIHIPVIP